MKQTKEDNNTKVKVFQSGSLHGFSRVGEKLGSVSGSSLLGHSLVVFGYSSPSAAMDHLTGTNIVFSRPPRENLILIVKHNGKEFMKTLYTGTEHNPHWKEFISSYGANDYKNYKYVDGSQNQDWFELDGIRNGDTIELTLQREIPLTDVLWDDTKLWNDSSLWIEQETVSVKWGCRYV